MKKRLTMILLLVTSVVCLAFGLSACGEGDGGEHPETGMYYYDTDSGNTYYVTLNDGSFLLQIADEIGSGTYEVKEDSTLDLSFTSQNATAVSMTYGDSVLSVTYGGSSMQFMRSLSYTVNYNACGGSEVASVKTINGKSVLKPADPVRAGYTFLGWYSDEGYTNAFSFGVTPVTADTTLYAKWSDLLTGEAEYTVWFDLGYEGATAPAAKTTVAGKLYGVETPVREGYTFGGWWVSDYESADMLTCRYSEDYKFTSSTTVYAQWIPAQTSGKLAAPLPRIEGNMVAWDAIQGANGYYVEIADPNGAKLVDRNVGATSVDVNFETSVAGQHVIKVTAVSSNAANNSETTVRYFNNKSLGKVSVFTVVEPSVLTYNAVENAEKYKISIVCGNASHAHKEIDNGRSTYFNFEGCEMKEGGIAFTVTAIAAGYSSTTSRTFYYNRQLGNIGEFYFDGATETVSWQSVENAADYAVTITAGSDTYKTTTGGKTYLSLRNYSAQDIKVSVLPVTKGYNSPSASEYSYKRTGLAAPTDVKVNGSDLVWNAVAGADQYVVNVSGADYLTTGKETTFKLSELSNLSNGVDYKINVRAIKAGGAQQSVPSETITAQYYSLSPAVTYLQNTVSWNPVIGAKNYEVRVNGGVVQQIAPDTTTASVTLTQSGENTISVRYIDENKTASDWVSITVNAYQITLDEREGSDVEDFYCALGDSLTFPVPERNGYELDGWYTAPGGADSNSGRYFDGDKLAVASDINLYAGWTAKSFSVIYMMDDYATVASNESKVTFREDYTLEMPVMNEDYVHITFLGWFSEPNGRGIQYTDPNGNSLDTWKYLKDAKVYPAWYEFLVFVLQTEGTYKDTYAVKKPSSYSYSNPFTKLVVPETYMGKPVTVVEGRTFSNLTYTTQVEIPDTIQLIYTESAFTGSKVLEKINIYKTGHTNDPVYSSDDGVLYYNDELSGVGKTLAVVPLAKTGHYVVQAGTKSIGSKVFSSTNLTSVTIPSSVVDIAYRAFYQSAITNIYFDRETGDELKIGKEAFVDCKALQSITLPSRIKDIDPVSVFQGTSSLENIFVYDDNESYSHVGGILCNKAGNTILYCPSAKRGDLRIPAGVRTIGDGAFRNCNKFYSVTIPAFVTKIGKNAFEGCSLIRAVTFDGANNVLGELTVDEGAFKNCKALAKITFHEKSKVVSIGYGAFENCTKISSVDLPDTLRDISSGLFAGCTGLVKVNVSENHPTLSSEAGVVYDKNKTEIKYYSINNTESTVVLPDTIKRIGANVFAGNLSITKIVIGNQVESIDKYAFKGCNNLETVVFVDGSDTGLVIGEYAFDGCASLANICVAASKDAAESTYAEKFPTRLRSIGEYAFNKAKLGAVVLEEGITEIGNYAFANTNITSITLPASLKVLGSYIFQSCSKVESVTLAENSQLEIIGKYAFSGLTKLKSFTIPKSVKTVGDYAFEGTDLSEGITFEERGAGDPEIFFGESVFYTSNITSLALPEGKARITAVMNNGYFDCTFGSAENLAEVTGLSNDECVLQDGVLYGKDSSGNLTSAMFCLRGYRGDVVIPNTVTEVYRSAFYGCMPTSITFQKGGTADLAIADYGFRNVGAVYNPRTYDYEPIENYCAIELPERLKSVGSYAFSDTGFSGLTFENNKTRMTVVSENAFSGMTKVKSLKLPAGIKRIEKAGFGAPFSGNMCVTELVLNNDLEYIGEQAFEGYTELTKLTIPASVEEIGSSAFGSCVSLEELTFAEGTRLALIGEDAFIGCQSLKSLTLPASYCGSAGVKGADGKYKGNGIMGDFVFAGCMSLESLTYEDGCPLITSVGTYALSGCVSLAKLTFPVNVKEIASQSFSEILEEYEDEVALKVIELSPDVSAQTIANLAEVIPFGIELSFGDKESTFVKIEDNGIVYEKDAAGNPVSLMYYPTSIEDKSFTVPATVRSFGNEAFANNEYLETVVLPEGIEEIGEEMFYRATALKSIKIPASVSSIGDYAFAYCKNLKEVTFETTASGSTSLTAIGDCAFAGCSSLVSLEIPDSVIVLGAEPNPMYIQYEWYDFIGAQFSGCNALTTVKLPRNLVELYPATFKNCRALTTVILPERSALNEVGLYAFKGCSKLKSIDFSNAANLESVGMNAFDGCSSLESATFAESGQLSLGKNVFSNTGLTSFKVPRQLREIGAYCFSGAKNLETVTVDPESRLKVIGDGAFENTALTTFAFGNTSALSTVGAYAFYGTKFAGAVNLPDGVSVIGDGAFGNCTGITQVDIPAAIHTIGDGAFENTAITSVTVGGSETSIGAKAFANCKNLAQINLESGVASIGNMAFAYTPITYIMIPVTVVSVIGNPFVGCVLEGMDILSTSADLVYEEGSLFNVDRTVIYCMNPETSGAFVVDDNVTTIMAGAFAGTKITSIKLPAKITEIAESTFKGCTELTSITIGKNVTTIGESAFEGCTKLETLTFEAGGTQALSIGKAAFKGCTALTELTIPHRLRNTYDGEYAETMYAGLAESAFEGCTSLVKVDSETVAEDFNTKAYGGTYLWIGVAAFKNCTNLESVTLGEGLGEGGAGEKDGHMISAYAFEGCVKLSEVKFAEALKYDASNFITWYVDAGVIDSYAFKGCASLETIEIPNYIFILGDYAFAESGLKTMVLPKKDMTKVTDTDYCYAISDYAFKNCTSLESFYCYGGFRTGSMSMGDLNFSGDIGEGVFEGCTSLKTVYFGEEEGAEVDEDMIFVSKFGDRAFAGCTALETVQIKFTAEGYSSSIGEECFKGCASLKNLDLSGYNRIYLYEDAFSGCTSLTELDLTKGVTVAGVEKTAFKGMSGLTVTVPFADAATATKALGEGWNGDATVVYKAPPAPAEPEA